MYLNAKEEELISRIFETYVAEYHHGDILKIITDANEETHQAVVIDAMQLFEVSMEVGDYFNACPKVVLAIFDEVLHKTSIELLKNASSMHVGGRGSKEQRLTLHTRITGLPVCPELTRDTIPRSSDVGRFLSVTGTVIRTGVAKVLEYERDYICNKCRHVFKMQADFEQYYTFAPLVACPNPDGCNSSKFSCLSGGSEPVACRDYQMIKIQEQVQKLSVGSIPRSLTVVLEDDLVDCCKSGDDVTIFGVMHQCWRPLYNGAHCDVELVLKANNVEVNNQQDTNALLMEVVEREFEEFWDGYKYDPIAGRNQILLSLCPQVFGMYVIKLAVAMVLAGGVQRIDSSGTKIRGECHMLLVGDPGTGKSQFLKYAAKIMPRSVLTAGIGSTSAGLTVAAVKDGGDWHLEAGALVLSDGGLCCIDEFNSIKEHDRISIHEAMEQQSISVAKAGIVCKLNTRTTILAATNPKGHYDPNEPLSVNVALASPLLSRFDLVLVLLDTRNPEWDRTISSYILENRGMPSESSSLWSMEKIKAYFCVIKQLQPQVSDEANCILTKYYQLQRQNEDRNAARTTIRMLESLSRLAEAHARLMYRETVTIEDAVIAVSVMECSMQGGGLLGNVNAILTSFPADPGQQYQTQCRVLLEGLNLPTIYEKEMYRLAKLRNKSSEMSTTLDHTMDHNRLQQSTPVHTTRLNSQSNSRLESGLDWFNSLMPSVSPNEMTSPKFSSTQKMNNGNSEFSCSKMGIASNEQNGQTEGDFLRNPSPSMIREVGSNATVTPALDDKNRKIKEKRLSEEKSLEKKMQPESEELSRCVVQKVPRNVRNRGVRGLQCGGEVGRDRLGSEDNAGDNLMNVFVENIPTGSSSSNDKDHITEKVAGKEQHKKKSITTVLREKMSAQIDKGDDIQAKMSGFSFKPRKMRPSVCNQELKCSRFVHKNRESMEIQQNEGSHSESGSHLAESRKKIQTQEQMPSSSMRKQVSCVGQGEETGPKSFCLTSVMLERPKSKRHKLDSLQRRDDSQSLCQKQTMTVNNDTETKSTSRSPSKPHASKSCVTSSTLAKLSRFSYIFSSQAKSSDTDTGQKDPLLVEERRDKSLVTYFDEVKTPNCPERSPSRKKLRTVVTSFDREDVSPAATELESTRDHEPRAAVKTKTMSKCSEKRTDHFANHNNGLGKVAELPVDSHSSEKQRKRKCFELCPALSTPTALFSNPSLFHSAQSYDDVFDTDWDQEISKTAKI